MPRGDKSKYTDKQRRKAEHIEEGYEKRGLSAKEAARRAWATVNKTEGGAQKGGSATKRGNKKRPATMSKAKRSQAAKKAAATRRRKKAKARRTTKARRTRSGAGRKRASK